MNRFWETVLAILIASTIAALIEELGGGYIVLRP